MGKEIEVLIIFQLKMCGHGTKAKKKPRSQRKLKAGCMYLSDVSPIEHLQ
jgi:hypothetical protein